MTYYGRFVKTKAMIVLSAARQANIPIVYRRVISGNKRYFDLYLANQIDMPRLQHLTPGIECVKFGV